MNSAANPTPNPRRELIAAIDTHIAAHGEPTPSYRWCIDSAPQSWLERELARIEAAAEYGNSPFNSHHIA